MTRASTGPVIVLGAGLTGLALAASLRRPVRLVERRPEVGGKARSLRRDGYTFDITGHWLHLRSERVQGLVRELFAAGELVEIERRTGIYSHGVMLPYPFQANLHGLPAPVVRECLVAFVAARLAAARRPEPARAGSFREYVQARFGAGMARHFFVPYNRKLWGAALEDLTAEWMGRFVPEPDVARVVLGALGARQEGLGYNARFLYPKSGGIDALPRALARRVPPDRVLLGRTVTRVEPRPRRVWLDDGSHLDYQDLVSTLPLPELVRRIDGAPSAVREAARRLRAVPWRYLDVAMRTPAPRPEHWIYVPEPRFAFFRVGIYSNALPAMAPPGGSALYVELSDREGPLDVPAVLRDLAELGAITTPEDVAFVQEHHVPHAYVVFDRARAEALDTIMSFLHGHRIHSRGRYGRWTYNSMEDCILDGLTTADALDGRAA